MSNFSFTTTLINNVIIFGKFTSVILVEIYFVLVRHSYRIYFGLVEDLHARSKKYSNHINAFYAADLICDLRCLHDQLDGIEVVLVPLAQAYTTHSECRN